MPDYVSAIYEPTEPDMPLVAVILEAGEVLMAFTVPSVDEGERRIRQLNPWPSDPCGGSERQQR